MIEHGIRAPGNAAVMIVGDGSFDEAHEQAAIYARQGLATEVVKVEVVGRYVAGVEYAPASTTCYICGRDRDGRSVGCPKRTHA